MQTWIVLLNWNGWRDTIECLESLLRLTTPSVGVIVCDNASEDGSCEKIQLWAEGKIAAIPANPQLESLSSPPLPKPLPLLSLTRQQAARASADSAARLVLIQTGANLGFAGGNNVGLRYALADRECQYFWLLNNDTVAEANALDALLQHMRLHREVGLCGSLNLSYHAPHQIQAHGGHRYNRWTGRVPASPRRPRHQPGTPPPIDYIHGASMLASRAFLEQVGLLDESYFLYFEELDWAMRSRGHFDLGYAPDSVIYHKEGASIGSHSDRNKRSLVSDQHLTRSRILFTRRHYPWQLPSVLLSVLAAAVYRLLRGNPKRAGVMLRAMLAGLRSPQGSLSRSEPPSISTSRHDVNSQTGC